MKTSAIQPNLPVLKMWIADLISGKNKQCFFFLRQTTKITAHGIRPLENEQYCAHGLLCELHRQQTGKGEWRGQHYFCDNSPSKFTRRGMTLPPPSVCEWAGIEYNPNHPDEQARRNTENFFYVAYLNDHSYSFIDIALFIAEKFGLLPEGSSWKELLELTGQEKSETLLKDK